MAPSYLQSPLEAPSTRDWTLSTEADVWRFHGCERFLFANLVGCGRCVEWMDTSRIHGGKHCFFFCRLHLTDWVSALIDCMCWRPSQVAVVRSNRLVMPSPTPNLRSLLQKRPKRGFRVAGGARGPARAAAVCGPPLVPRGTTARHSKR